MEDIMFLIKLFQKKFSHTKKLYTKVLFSFIILAFLIVLSTSLVFSAMYMKIINEQLAIDSINDVEKLATEFDNVFKQFKDTVLYLIQLPDINTFLYSYDIDDYLTLNRADMISRQIRNLNPYLNSIILYNKDVKCSLMSGKLNLDKNQFMTESMRTPDTKSNLNMVFSSISDDSRTDTLPEETISLLFNDSDNKSILYDSSIVMTVSKSDLEKSLLEKIEGITLAADNSGKVIFTSDKTQINKTISNQRYFQKIVSAQNPIGNFKIKVNSKNKIISYTKSLLTGFYIINVLDTHNYTQIILKNEITILSISVMILLVFLFIGYFISKNIYSPIREVTDLFSGSRYSDTSDAPFEEIATISRVFNNALRHINELEVRGEDNNIRLKEEFLRRLLIADASEDNIYNEIRLYKFNIEFDNTILCCIRIDNFSQIGRNKKPAYESTLWSIFSEVLSYDFKYETVNMYEGEAALFLNFRNTSENNFNLIVSAMDKVREISKGTLSITLSIGIGGAANSAFECIHSYRKAIDLVNHRFILGPDHTVYQRLMEDILISNSNYPDEMSDKLIKAIRLGKKDDFVNTLHDIIELFKRYPYSKSVSMLFQLITECIKTINQVSQQDSNKYYLGLEDINYTFRSLETLEQAKEWLINIFDNYLEIMEKINQLKNNKHYSLVEKMQNYIKQNYHDTNINVESLSDMAGYTSYYFSKIFKDITGLAVIDYIRKVRIDKAKELLSLDHVKVSEIPGMIGFSNSGYFYSTFKKDVGLTPSAYKEYILSKNSSEFKNKP
jgi:two-component system, response regulator YesN